MPLPSEPRAPLSDEPGVLIIYGPPKIGKTSSVAQLEGALFLDCEQPAGTRFVTCMSVPISTYAGFMSACKEIVDGGRKYKFVVVDTIDALERLCIQEANIRYLKSNSKAKDYRGSNILTDLEHGAGYTWLWDAMRDALDAVGKTCDRIILVGHLKEKLLPNAMLTEDSEGADLDLTGKVKNIVCSRADAIGLLKRRPRPGVRPPVSDLHINFRSSEVTNAGIRIKRLAGKELLFASADDERARWEEIYTTLKK